MAHPLDNVPEILARGEIKILYIFGEPGSPAYAYSIGMTNRGKPELVMEGFTSDLMYALIQAAAKIDAPFTDGQILKGLASCDLAVRLWGEDSRASEPLYQALSYYEVEKLPVAQIVVPDPDGRFPWDPGCDPDCIEIQGRFGDITAPPGPNSQASPTSRLQ